MEQTPRAFFQMTFEPIGRVCAPQGTHAVGLGWRENGERVRTAHTLHASYGLLGLLVILNFDKESMKWR